MISLQRINLKDRETKFSIESISSKRIKLNKDRRLAKDFEWYSWFYYKILIKILFGGVVNRSTIIEFIGMEDEYRKSI